VTSSPRAGDDDQKRVADAARAAQVRRLRSRRKRGRRNATESGHHQAEVRSGAR
jgi:hypothetical protein